MKLRSIHLWQERFLLNSQTYSRKLEIQVIKWMNEIKKWTFLDINFLRKKFIVRKGPGGKLCIVWGITPAEVSANWKSPRCWEIFGEGPSLETLSGWMVGKRMISSRESFHTVLLLGGFFSTLCCNRRIFWKVSVLAYHSQLIRFKMYGWSRKACSCKTCWYASISAEARGLYKTSC